MADKIKPLKFENPSLGGTQIDFLPTEANPTEDYLSAKGIAFEGLDTFLVEKIGRILTYNEPDITYKPAYLGNGDLDYLEVFNSATQIDANRILKIVIAYSGGNISTETMSVYSNDGVTVLRTITTTHTFTGNNWTNAGVTTS